MAIPRTDNVGLRPVAPVEATRAITPLGDTRQDSIDRLVRLEVGKQFQAQILSRFNDGTFLVRIADTAARLALPGAVKVGDGVALTLVSINPRPTFNLDSRIASAISVPTGEVGRSNNSDTTAQAVRVITLPTGGAEGGNMSSGLAQTVRTAGVQLAQALYQSNSLAQAGDVGGAPAALSTTGRMITELLNVARESGAGTVLVGKTPLATNAGIAAPQLASALQTTLTQSGLFYESHVAQWANYQRPMVDLLHEPQAQGKPASYATSYNGAWAPATEVPPPEVVANQKNLLEYFGTASLPGAAHASASLDVNAAQLINLQLNALEQQRVRWQGELWPGQPLEWEVSRQQQDEASDADSGAPATRENWQSVVRFSLPGLGVVAATINLAGNRIQVQVKTASVDTATALRQYGPHLANALDAAGSTLEQLTIKHEVPADGAV